MSKPKLEIGPWGVALKNDQFFFAIFTHGAAKIQFFKKETYQNQTELSAQNVLGIIFCQWLRIFEKIVFMVIFKNVSLLS